jgi:hypothetical protein
VAAVNKYGPGLYSETLTVVAAQAPDQPDAPQTETFGFYVKLTWTAPTENNAPITHYQVLLEESDGEFVENKSLCDGSTVDLSALECLIPMTAFRLEPYLMDQGDIVKAKVIAFNERGQSLQSNENSSGSEIEIEPHQVTNLRQDQT